MEDCREFHRLEESGYQEELRSRYSHLRRYFPAFLKLPFKAEPGTQTLLAGISLAREMNEGKHKAIPLDAPIEFVPAAWRAALKQSDGTIDKRLWGFPWHWPSAMPCARGICICRRAAITCPSLI